MEEKLQITFKVTVYSKLNYKVDEFTVEAETKKEAHGLVITQLKAQGIYENVTYKIT